MDKYKKLNYIREKLKKRKITIGSWIQIPDSNVAEIMGNSGYDWVAVDLEHGNIAPTKLPDLFRSLELGNTLPIARVAFPLIKDCKLALDAGAIGLIIPMIKNGKQLADLIENSLYPPNGKRGVGFCRANLYGRNFEDNMKLGLKPLIIPQIENTDAINNLDNILENKNIDAILIGPYDLSASLGCTGKFDDKKFKNALETIKNKCSEYNVPAGIHIVEPCIKKLKQGIKDGFKFIAYSIDSVFIEYKSDISKLNI
jgi:2-dehydro-3-deoxyglucarate aldolase